MEGNNPTLIDFPEFYKEYLECLKLQEWKQVNNRTLSIFLRDHPEKFLEYLMEILSGNYPYKSKTSAILIMKQLVLNKERIETISSAFKTKMFGFLFGLAMELVAKSEFFAIVNIIIEFFSNIFQKFNDEKVFLPKEILNNLGSFKNLAEGPLFKIVFFFISKVYYNDDNETNANLLEINDFLSTDLENMTDPYILSCHLNVSASLFRANAIAENNEQLMKNILKIMQKVIQIDEIKKSVPILEEFIGYFVNFISMPVKIPENELVCQVLAFQQNVENEIRKVLLIFLSNCTNSDVFDINDELINQVIEVFLRTLRDSISDIDEAWLQDISFDKMSSEQNNICDYETLSHFHFVSMILFSNLEDSKALLHLKKFSTQKDWKSICALLTALTNLVSFSSNDTMYQVYPYIFSCLSHENPKIRLAALKLIEELSIEFGKDFYKKTQKSQEAKILSLLEDPVPRVRIMSTFSVISYLNEIPKKESRKKLESFFPMIKTNIDKKCYYFLPEILSLASEFVHQLDLEANDYSKEMIPLVIGIKAEGLSPMEEANFNGKIMEFISIFIQAISTPSNVNPYKEQILNLLLVNQGKITNAITLNDIYLLDAWQRMALIYQKEIQNYLAVVIGKMIPLGIKYMKDKEEFHECNELFKGNYPRIYHTEINKDQEVIKNLGEILKMFLESSDHEAIKNCETLIVFLNTSYKNIVCSLKRKMDESVKESPSESTEDDNVYYEDLNYFYKDLVSCCFLFLQHYSHKTSPQEFLSNYRRLNNALWQIIENNPINDKPLIKLLYTTFESIKFSLLEVPNESFTSHDLNPFLMKIKQEWLRVVNIDFHSYAGEEEEENEEEEEAYFGDLRIDFYFVIHEIITNLMKILNEEQKETLITSLFEDLYLSYLNEYYSKEYLTEIEENILSSILFSLVEILQEVTPEFFHEHLPWKKILENVIKYSNHSDTLICHNSCYALGLFHEKVEPLHHLYPEILDYVPKSVSKLEEATKLQNKEKPEPKHQAPEINNDGTIKKPKEGEENEEDYESDDGDLEVDFWECMDNVYSSIGRMIKIYYGNNDFIKPDLIQKYLKYLPIKHDRGEGKDQHEILLLFMLKSWSEIFQIVEGSYSELMRIFGEVCLQINEDITELKTKKKIKKLCNILKSENALNFQTELGKLEAEKKKALEEFLSNKEFDED